METQAEGGGVPLTKCGHRPGSLLSARHISESRDPLRDRCSPHPPPLFLPTPDKGMKIQLMCPEAWDLMGWSHCGRVPLVPLTQTWQ